MYESNPNIKLMRLEDILELCIKNLAEYEKKQLIIMLTNHMLSHASTIEADVIYRRVVDKIIKE